MKICRSLALGATVFALSGCAVQQAQRDIEAAEVDLSNVLAQQSSVKPTGDNRTGPVRSLGRVYLGSQVVASVPEIPPRLEEKRGISIDRSREYPFRTVEEIARDLQRATGLRVKVSGLTLSEDAKENVRQRGGAPVVRESASPEVEQLITNTAPLGLSGISVPGAVKLPDNRCNWVVSYSGALSRFLDMLASECDVQVEVTSEGISIYRYVTFTERLSLPTAVVEASSTVSGVGASQTGGGAIVAGNATNGVSENATGGDSGNSTGSQSGLGTGGGASLTSKSAAYDPWGALSQMMRTVLPPDSRLVVSPAVGSVIITARPEAAERALKIVREEQRWQSLYVEVTGKLVALRNTTSDGYSMLPEIIGKSRDITLAWNGPTSTAGAGAGSITATVVNAASRLSGTQVVVEALSKAGKVLDIQDISGMAMNHRPVPLSNGQGIPYTAGTQTVVVPNVGPVTTRIAGLETVGLSLRLVPHIGRDLVVMDITLTQANLLDYVTEGSGENFTRRPLTSRAEYDQEVPMRDGQTIVIGGFERLSRRLEKSGVGAAWNPVLGGGLRGELESAKLYLILSIRVVDPLSSRESPK
ncbi:hypothetical protein GE253_23105 [Niveispirillum sp. SYP-B3756]|uniref:hypothetical protein n=1 Tax=Niveispirillum sp. SYP-B3756 TaxID=2662178 RepID=UPI0012923612|nr:hypothetical protein [Niveispirillum sp. SYP-B3756]MQP68211.1 hypothetical protein [Niveispirillum sp. SYP-B3756]